MTRLITVLPLVMAVLATSAMAQSPAPAAPATPATEAPTPAASPSNVGFVHTSGKQALLGWHPSGVAYVTVDGKDVHVCRDDGNDLPSAWPPGVAIGPGILCAPLTDDAAGAQALPFAKQEVLGQKTTKTSPFGLRAVVEGNQLQVADGARIKVLGVLSGPHKLVDAQWRADGSGVALSLEPVPNPAGVRLITLAHVPELLVGGDAGKKVAAQREKEAAVLLKKRDWSAAGTLLEQAIVANPSSWSARYARASAEAQSGLGRTAMIDNLTVLKEKSTSTPAAKQVLERAKNDRAFDAWSGDPEIRALIGLPELKSMDMVSRLLERTANWSIQGSSCNKPWLTLVFGKGSTGGSVVLEVVDGCKGKKTKTRINGSWKLDAGAGRVVLKVPAGAPWPADALISLDDSYQQLRLKPAVGDVLGTFEPGPAQLDDAVL
jgi:hypothetical protein